MLSARGEISTFRALQYRDFRLIWTGFAVSAIGTWMQVVAVSLLVLELTGGSAAALGTVSLAQALAFLLLSPVSGSVVDRIDRRRLLLTTQTVMMSIAALLGVLAAADAVEYWMLPLLAFINSAALSFDQPVRNALVGTLVPKEHIMNAVSLQSATFNATSMLGPALAGWTLSRLDYQANFFLNAASYLAMIGALLAIRTRHAPAAEGAAEGPWSALQHIRRDAALPAVIPAFAALLFFAPSMSLALPVFAERAALSAQTLGWMFSAVGAGTILSALAIASLGDVRNKVSLMFGSGAVWVAALAVLAVSRSLWIVVPALLILGASQNGVSAATITMLQTRVPPQMRGRAMTLYSFLIMCVRPLGDFPAGAVIGWLGFQSALLVSAGVVGLILGWLYAVHEGGRLRKDV